jgi:hypothetical protein
MLPHREGITSSVLFITASMVGFGVSLFICKWVGEHSTKKKEPTLLLG